MTGPIGTPSVAAEPAPSPAAPGAHRRPGSRRRLLLGAAAAAVVAGAVVAFVVVRSGDDGPRRDVIDEVPGRGLDTAGTQLATLLTGARSQTFHAVYRASGDEQLLGGTLTLEWWNTEGRSRVDTTRVRDGQTVRTATIVDGDRGTSCRQVPSQDWSCTGIDVPAPGDPGGIVTSLTAQLAGRSVTEKAGTVGGRAARCFAVGGGTEPIEVCTNAAGVLLRNASADVTYEVSALDSDVPDSVFDPPSGR